MSSLSDQEARRLLLQGSPLEADLWYIGHAIDRRGAAVGQVDAAIVQDIFELSWPGAAHRREQTSYTPKQIPEGPRRFLPVDLKPEHERPLLDLAVSSSNVLAKARIFDVLYERFRQPTYARTALWYLQECVRLHPGIDDWPTLEEWSARSLHLACVVLRDPFCARLALSEHEAAAGRVLKSAEFRFAFSLFADTLVARVSRYLRTSRFLSDDDVRRWVGALELVAIDLKLRRTWSNIHGVRDAQEALLRLVRDDAGVTAVRRSDIQDRLDEAEAREDVAMVFIHQAMTLAGNHGFTDLLDQCKVLLPAAIEREGKKLKPDKESIEITRDEVLPVVELIHHSDSVESAIRALSTAPKFTTLPIDQLEEAAAQWQKESVFFAMIGGYRFSGGKVTHASHPGRPGTKTKEAVAYLAQRYVARIEFIVSYFLGEAFDEGVDEQTLLRSLGPATWLGRQRQFMFANGARHFAKQDWYSAGLSFSLAYEGFLRDFLRAGGYPALKYDPDGTTSDELLNSLAWKPGEIALGRKHMALVRYLLCDSEIGPNLRNEVAHCTIEPGQLSASRVFLIALLCIRLTLLQPVRVNNDIPEDAKGEDEVAGAAEESEHDENVGGLPRRRTTVTAREPRLRLVR